MNDKLRYSVQSEVECDPTAIGFAYGGVLPGHVHSKGALHEVHKVYFSIARVGCTNIVEKHLATWEAIWRITPGITLTCSLPGACAL